MNAPLPDRRLPLPWTLLGFLWFAVILHGLLVLAINTVIPIPRAERDTVKHAFYYFLLIAGVLTPVLGWIGAKQRRATSESARHDAPDERSAWELSRVTWIGCSVMMFGVAFLLYVNGSRSLPRLDGQILIAKILAVCAAILLIRGLVTK